MQKTFNHKLPQPNMISRALSRPAERGEGRFELIDGVTDNNLLQLGIGEQLQRMQLEQMFQLKKNIGY